MSSRGGTHWSARGHDMAVWAACLLAVVTLTGCPVAVDDAYTLEPVSEPGACNDKQQGGRETDVDCGGPDCPDCEAGQRCAWDGDCGSNVCDNEVCQRPDCEDLVRNGEETDVDCGGTSCPGCGTGQLCDLDADCRSGVCGPGLCLAR